MNTAPMYCKETFMITKYTNDYPLYADPVGKLDGITFTHYVDNPDYVRNANSFYCMRVPRGMAGSLIFDTVVHDIYEDTFTIYVENDEFKYTLHEVELLRDGSAFVGTIKPGSVYNFVCRWRAREPKEGKHNASDNG